MYYKYDLPKNMITVIENENIDFSVKAKRGKPIRSSISIIIFGLVGLHSVVFLFMHFLALCFSEKKFISHPTEHQL